MGPAMHLFCSVLHIIVAPHHQNSLVDVYICGISGGRVSWRQLMPSPPPALEAHRRMFDRISRRISNFNEPL